ncbi:TniQ family protein [Streptomyces sp. NPDC051286]|uniref:TniQ family protein n=1 Tax=Streptomyces sp. NPDC051286 TaxID=3365647 RepID=UPI00379915FD
MSSVRRWPLHPQPGPLESLSSWLERLARPYEIRVADLLTRNLGLVDVAVPDDLDYDPPATMLAALAERTGVEIARLRAMTLAGWEPWLIEGLIAPIEDTQPVFDAYVRDNSCSWPPARQASTRSRLSGAGRGRGWDTGGYIGTALCAPPIPSEGRPWCGGCLW